MDCSHPCPGVGDLTATAGGGGTMEISWTAPLGYVDNYDIYRDDEYIGSTSEPYYLDEGLEDGIYVYCVVTTFIDGCIGQTKCVEGVCSDPNTNSCNLQFDLFDSYGDGWNGAALLVSFSDGSPSQSYTISSGNYAAFTLEVNSGTTVTLTWQPGGNDSECYFVVSYADNGIEIYSVSDPSSGFLYEFVMGPGVEDLTATAVGGGTMEISWTDPTGDIDHYDLYRDDVLIATTTATSYTDEGLEDGIYVYCVVTTSIGGCVGQTECVEGVCSDPITNSCNLLFDLYDSGGDGWNDAALLVSFSDGSPSQVYTLFSGSSAHYFLEVNSGTTVTLTWQPGGNDSECYFVVSYADNGIYTARLITTNKILVTDSPIFIEGINSLEDILDRQVENTDEWYSTVPPNLTNSSTYTFDTTKTFGTNDTLGKTIVAIVPENWNLQIIDLQYHGLSSGFFGSEENGFHQSVGIRTFPSESGLYYKVYARRNPGTVGFKVSSIRYVKADNGIEIYSVSDPSEGFLYEFVMDCSPQCAGVKNLTATSGNGGTMEISWTAPIGDVDHYDIYRDDVLIATTTTTSYTDEGLQEGSYVYCVVKG